jgi:hypothetical protein
VARPRKSLAAVTGLALTALAALTAAAPASADPSSATYTVTVGSTGGYAYPTDTPASSYIDKDGTFYFQQSAALYGATEGRVWDFYSGTNFDNATKNSAISNAVNPSNSNDKNNDTTWRCNNSPTGLTSSYDPVTTSYSQKNFCDLVGVWVDPDTGDWYGLVHNEFTPQPFGDGIHFDAIDWAKSTNQGKVWTIVNHAITSPYSTTRGDTTAFPNQTYSYGDGDPRLFVDQASGYFYVYYGSRLVDKNGNWGDDFAHVARAPLASKMATGSWQKWYNGAWSQPGVGGQESNMVPVDSTNTTGYTPVANEYSPANTGSVSQQIAAGKIPAKSPLFVTNIAYDAYLGLYIAEPEVVDQSAPQSQQFYVTDNLATQKWYLAGTSGTYKSDSWYRWFVDSANKTLSNSIVGKNFRSYCSIACAKSDGEYANMTVDSTAPAPPPVDTAKTYTIGTGTGRVLAQVSGGSATTSVAAATGSALQAWAFTANGDGSYRVTNSSTGQALGVDSSTTSTRAWGAKPTVTALSGGTGSVGQQWFVVAGKSAANTADGTFRLVNRHSGLVLGLSSDSTRLAETTPARSWTNGTGNAVGGTRTAAEQTLTFTVAGSSGAEAVTVANPGTQTGQVGAAVSLQVTATDSQNKALNYSATGLPAGLSISSTGLISGTPSTTGSSTVSVTASSGTASGSTSFGWTVNAAGSNLNGQRTVVASGKALDDPGHSTTAGTQLITYAPNSGLNQKWTFTQQADGSYSIANGESNLCVDVSGGSTSAGAKIIQWTCTAGPNQEWTATSLGGGVYTLKSVKSGLLLTTASTADGALVTQQADTNSALQHWTIS